MQLEFKYDEDMDIECLLSKGGGSINSPGKMTKTYEELIKSVSDIRDKEKVRGFIRSFMVRNGFDAEKNVLELQKNWDSIATKFVVSAEKIFDITLEGKIRAFLTITGRWPYSIPLRYFYVSARKTNANATAMHELFHFYTWERFGDQEKILGPQKYNDMKEAFSAILNIEFADLMNGEVDNGYPQHKDMRTRAVEAWLRSQNIAEVWQNML